MKRIVALLLAILLTASLAACSQTSPEATTAGQSSGSASTQAVAESTAPDPMGKYDKPVTITAVRSLGPAGMTLPKGETLENNIWSRLYEETLGIKIQYLWTANDSDYTQKLNIAITSNDLPDVMYANSAQLKMMVDNGQAADISGVYKDYAADYTKEVMDADSGRALKSATFGGKLYAIPQMGTGLQSTQVLWIRTDWLNNLNLKIPQTIDEMLAVADAFTNGDPDKNSKNDTFGMGITKDLFGSYSALQGFFNSYGAYPNIWIPGESGNLAYGSTQPQIKTALAALQKMYSTNILDREFGVKDANKVGEDVNAGKIGMFFGEFWNGAWIQDAKIKNPAMEWMPASIPSNNGTPSKAQVPFAITLYNVVGKNCKNPEAVIKLLNIDLEKLYGSTAEPGKYSIDADGNNIGQAALIYCEPYKKNFTAAQHVIAAMESKDPSKLTSEEKEYYEKNLRCLEGDFTCWHNFKMFGPDGTLTVMNQYDLDSRTMYDQFYGAPTTAMSEKKSTLEKLQLTKFTDIIMGAPIDDFDKFVADWGKLGGEQMTTEVNEWFKQQ